MSQQYLKQFLKLNSNYYYESTTPQKRKLEISVIHPEAQAREFDVHLPILPPHKPQSIYKV